MDQQRYDIYFTGKVAEGVSEETAQQNLAQLFKTSVDKVGRLFNGKPQILKRGMDKTASLKYKAAFENAGLVVAFKKVSPTAPEPTPAAAAATVAAEPPVAAKEAAASDTGDMSLAPVGSDVLREEERRVLPEADIDTSNIKLVSAFMEPENEEKPAPPPPPDTSHISVAAAGEDLLADKPAPPPALDLNIDDISLAPPGADLEELHEDIPALNPDTSALSIAEPGADVNPDRKEATPPPPPNVDHLSVDKD